jgi:ATP-dependent RNA helicase RhlE
MPFSDLPIDPRCLALLTARGIVEPTPIQAAAIPHAHAGEDLIGIAQTGTGKTLAFGLPALARLAARPRRNSTGMLVLAPTRELAQQVHDVIAPMAVAMGMNAACVYGGVGMEPQVRALRRGTDIIVACPGRLIDHINQRNVRFEELSILVLDEADRMLDMGFLPDIRRVIAALPASRQTMMFSATFPPEIAQLAGSMLRNPRRVEAPRVAKTADAVRQQVYLVARENKGDLLRHILHGVDVGPTIVFMRTKRATDRLARVLSRDGVSADAIHGDQSQGRRTRAIESFRNGRCRVLVATDVAARGIDIKGISHVINYDIPSTPEDYVHRIGRTARAEATGDAITFITPEDMAGLRDIERTVGRALPRSTWGAFPESAAAAPKAQPPARRAQQPRRPARPAPAAPNKPAGNAPRARRRRPR